MSRQLYVNVPVKDLARSKDFFAALGFSFEPKFTDDKAACMIVNDQTFFMLLSEPFFKGFTRREIADTTRSTEALFALSCSSRAEVDQLVRTAIERGGSHAMEPQDHGFMYGWSFYDLDGHHWEVLWMDPAGMQVQ